MDWQGRPGSQNVEDARDEGLWQSLLRELQASIVDRTIWDAQNATGFTPQPMGDLAKQSTSMMEQRPWEALGYGWKTRGPIY